MDLSAEETKFVESLPPVIKAVTKALGLIRAKEFLIEHGGINMNIPKYRASNKGLSQEELEALNKHLANHMDASGRIWVPTADKFFIYERNVQIRKDKENLSIRDLARRYRLSSKQIMNICRPDEQ